MPLYRVVNHPINLIYRKIMNLKEMLWQEMIWKIVFTELTEENREEYEELLSMDQECYEHYQHLLFMKSLTNNKTEGNKQL